MIMIMGNGFNELSCCNGMLVFKNIRFIICLEMEGFRRCNINWGKVKYV